MSALWYVKLPDGDVQPLTLDELDEAFQVGNIDPDTLVLAAGATQWAKLGELAGLEQPPVYRPEPAPFVHHRSAQALPSSLRPVSVDLGMLAEDDELFAPRKRGGKKWVFGMVLVAGVLGVAAFQAQRSGGVVSLGRMSLAALRHMTAPPAAAAPAPPPAPPVATAPDPVAAATASAPAPYNALTDVSNRFTAEQKEKLAAADKQLQQKSRARQKMRAGATSAPAPGPKPKSQGFTTNGNKFDPLNATIP